MFYRDFIIETDFVSGYADGGVVYSTNTKQRFSYSLWAGEFSDVQFLLKQIKHA